MNIKATSFMLGIGTALAYRSHINRFWIGSAISGLIIGYTIPEVIIEIIRRRKLK